MIRSTGEHQGVVPYSTLPVNLSQRSLAQTDIWQRLPMDLARALHEMGICACSGLRDTSLHFLVQQLPYSVFSKYRDLFQELRRPEGPRTFQAFRLLSGRGLAENVHLHQVHNYSIRA